MKNKKIIIAVIALVAVIGIMVGIWFATRPKTQEGSKAISVTVVHADGSSKDFTYQTDEEYLGAVLTAEGLISGFEGEYGLVIEVVDEEEAVWDKNGAYWALFVGEEYATTGISTTPVTDGGSYKLVYTLG